MLGSDRIASRVRAIIDPWVSKRKNLSVALGVIRKEEQDTVGYGFAMGEEIPAGDLIYEIGSVTKVFTTSLLSALACQGVVSLNDPISKYLSPTLQWRTDGAAGITLEQLATHTSGLPRLPGNLRITRKNRANPYADYTVEQLYAFLSGYRSKKRLPAKFAYSNLGGGLLGHILATALGTTYEDAVYQYICAPLHMEDTRVVLDPPRQRRLVQGHSASGRPVRNWDLPTLAGAGALKSTVNDMLKFLSANMGLRDTPVADCLAACHTPRAKAGRRWHVGLGWIIDERDGNRVVWHNGGTGGYNSHMTFIKEKGVGVCVLTNHTVPLTALIGLTKPHADDIGEKVLAVLLD